MTPEETIQQHRQFMKSNWAAAQEVPSDQFLGVPPPPLEKPAEDVASRLALPPPNAISLKNNDLRSCLYTRRSRREYSPAPLTLEELSFLLWATQGVLKLGKMGNFTLRTVPSAGARHPFETYLCVTRVTGLETGVYRYLPVIRFPFSFRAQFGEC